MKRQISKANFSLISTEIEHYESSGLITGEQKNEILEIYELKGGLNFIRVVVTIGAILVGLGILSFIASNWNGISHLIKLLIIFGVFSGVNIAGFMFSESYPKTGRSLIYLGMLVYGAGIFLIGQMYNFGGEFPTAFLLWSFGVVPMAFQLKDKYLMLFANILFGVYLNGSYNLGFPYAGWVGVPIVYLAFNYFERSKLLLFFANLTTLSFILQITLRYDVKGLYVTLIFFTIGLLMYGIKHNLGPDIFRVQGNILLGVTGVILTVPELWDVLVRGQSTRLVSILFALAFIVLLFVLIRKGSLISLIFVCITIFRYYTDTFAFLPKSLFFIVGGLLLLGFGYYFERMMKTPKGGTLV
ncbi:putative membrane protein [Candidatus Desulfosporosinus infrequens]|uniref:Putative membrane protein n=1 Tax=Candidatus Desulfosporosinus infrequens TaxID=2043169 RepID=A0A2U3LLA2_9FIRM|nr:putative membrane protein [Candidatus Desulfosporosinus infrequens]